MPRSSVVGFQTRETSAFLVFKSSPAARFRVWRPVLGSGSSSWECLNPGLVYAAMARQQITDKPTAHRPGELMAGLNLDGVRKDSYPYLEAFRACPEAKPNENPSPDLEKAMNQALNHHHP